MNSTDSLYLRVLGYIMFCIIVLYSFFCVNCTNSKDYKTTKDQHPDISNTQQG